MEIKYQYSNSSVSIRLSYIVKHDLRISHFGKHWPKTTQCLIYYNDILVSFGEVTKHVRDADNQFYAYKIATKKALEKTVFSKETRTNLWKLLLKSEFSSQHLNQKNQ